MFLKLAQAIRFRQPAIHLPVPTKNASRLEGPVVIVAGYCGEPATTEHSRLVEQAFEGFRGTIISGGTTAGISALVGELRARSGDVIRAVGYVPSQLPPDVQRDSRYTEIRETSGTDFSPLEPLQYWADLYASGVTAEQIRLLCFGGGRISAAECQMALAFGVTVGLLQHNGGNEVEHCLEAPPWTRHPGYHRLPVDERTIRAFLGLT